MRHKKLAALLRKPGVRRKNPDTGRAVVGVASAHAAGEKYPRPCWHLHLALLSQRLRASTGSMCQEPVATDVDL
jgi:hypothetical protein